MLALQLRMACPLLDAFVSPAPGCSRALLRIGTARRGTAGFLCYPLIKIGQPREFQHHRGGGGDAPPEHEVDPSDQGFGQAGRRASQVLDAGIQARVRSRGRGTVASVEDVAFHDQLSGGRAARRGIPTLSRWTVAKRKTNE